jgi:hypothetical protein
MHTGLIQRNMFIERSIQAWQGNETLGAAGVGSSMPEDTIRAGKCLMQSFGSQMASQSLVSLNGSEPKAA